LFALTEEKEDSMRWRSSREPSPPHFLFYCRPILCMSI